MGVGVLHISLTFKPIALLLRCSSIALAKERIRHTAGAGAGNRSLAAIGFSGVSIVSISFSPVQTAPRRRLPSTERSIAAFFASQPASSSMQRSSRFGAEHKLIVDARCKS